MYNVQDIASFFSYQIMLALFNKSLFSFLSERETADRNYALSYYMREHKVGNFCGCSNHLTLDYFSVSHRTRNYRRRSTFTSSYVQSRQTPTHWQ